MALLRASGQHTGQDYDLSAVLDETGEGSGVPHARELTAFAEAVLGPDEGRLEAARRALVDTIGEAALVDTAAVAANFNAIDRVADATGIPLEAEKAEATADFRAQLGIDGFGKSGDRDAAAE